MPATGLLPTGVTPAIVSWKGVCKQHTHASCSEVQNNTTHMEWQVENNSKLNANSEVQE
jgi:hypothetical protein